MSRFHHTPLLLALVGCILVVLGAMVVAVTLAGRKPTVVIMPVGGGAAPAAAVAAGATAPAPAAGAPAAAAPKAPEITVARVPALPNLAQPLDPAWDKVPAIDVPLQPQQTAAPMLDRATIPALTVQAARDDQRVAWRLSWPAVHPAERAETGAFPDAVALQFAMVDNAPFTMGGKGAPVRILHWTALWQKDLDAGFQDIQQLYPHAYTDMYLSTAGTPMPGMASPSKDGPQALVIARAAGNPMASPQRGQPLEEVIAEGFGSSTAVPDSPSRARGVWKDGRWTVVIDRPLDPKDPLAARLQSAATPTLSFAVWDGAAGNRGGRKHYCTWVPLRIQP